MRTALQTWVFRGGNTSYASSLQRTQRSNVIGQSPGRSLDAAVLQGYDARVRGARAGAGDACGGMSVLGSAYESGELEDGRGIGRVAGVLDEVGRRRSI